MVKKKVAVIGAGIGGLSAALRLKYLGCDVDVFEKNLSVGGKAGEISIDGFRFDLGPSLLTMPFVLEDLFSSAELDINNYLTLKKLDVTCKYFFPDSTEILSYCDTNKFAKEIETNTIDNANSVLNYLEYCKRIYDHSADLFLNHSFSEVKTFLNLKALKTLLNIKSLDTHRKMHDANKSFFKDEKTIQLFDRYATYSGSNPYEAPATLNIIQHVEFNLGGYISLTGINSIPKAIKSAGEKLGVNFFYNSNVEKICTTKDKITGLIINGAQRDYDIIVSNADVEFTYKRLLGDYVSSSSKRYDKLEKSTSAIIFYWGIEGLYSNLEIHNILFSSDYKNEFKELFDNHSIPSDPTIYIYISSKFKKDDAPLGCENWFVMINAPHDSGQDWNGEIEKARKKIISRINTQFGINLESKIKCERVITPKSLEEKTSSIGGSIYGISSNTKMAAFMRQKNRSKDYKGLYFCGGSAHPGGGIPLVVLSGKITSELINKYELN